MEFHYCSFGSHCFNFSLTHIIIYEKSNQILFKQYLSREKYMNNLYFQKSQIILKIKLKTICILLRQQIFLLKKKN